MIEILTGDCRKLLAAMPENSIHCCVTSPPYFGLRDYGTASWLGGEPACDHKGSPQQSKSSTLAGNGHGDGKPLSPYLQAQTGAFREVCGKCGALRVDSQIGLEKTPDEFVAQLVAVFREVRRVLRDDGTLWLNLGDSYAGSWGAQGRRGEESKNSYNASVVSRQQIANHPKTARNTGLIKQDGLKPKDLIGIPWRVAFALQQPYYTGQIKDERDRVWLAAVIDGEGCFFVHKRKAGASAHSKFTRADGSEAAYLRTADTYGVGLEISNTNKALIDEVARIVPGGTYTTQGPEQNSRRKQTIYRWRLAPNEAKRLAQELYPHLIAKQHQARIIFNCPSNGDGGADAHQAMKDLHNGVATSVDFAAPASLFEPGWYLRQDIIWGKPNPMPESVTDRCTKAHEYIFLFSKSPRYFYDADAIAEPAAYSGLLNQDESGFKSPQSFNGKHKAGYRSSGNKERKSRADHGGAPEHGGNQAFGVPWEGSTRNKRSVWTVATAPYSEAHFATFPSALIEPCILAGCPVGGTVLDPFGGAGTTGLVADRNHRSAVLIELNPAYAEMARRRIHDDAPLFSEAAQ